MAVRTIRISLHGNKLGITDAGHLAGEGLAGLIVGDLPGNIYAEATGPFLKQTQFDDFLGKTISGQWNLQKGSDGATVNFANTAANLGGAAVGTMGANAGVSYATNGVQIDDGVLAWQANKGGLMMEARVKTDALTSRAIFIGFTDQVAALEMPFTIAAAVLTSNASDAVGFLFDTAATAATVKLVGVANDVDDAVQDVGVAGLATAAYHLFRVEIDALGNTAFYIDGLPVGTLVAGTNYNMAAALRPSIPLSPVVAGFTRAAGTGTITLDWLRAQQTRPA